MSTLAMTALEIEEEFRSLTLWISRRFRCPQDAEDYAQEAFVRLLQNPDVRTRRQFLRTVAANKWRDTQRRRATWVEPLEVDVSSPAPCPAEEFERRVVAQEVRLAIATLPEPYQRILHLRYECGLRCVKISPLVGLSPSVVRTTKHRAIGLVREELARRHPIEAELERDGR